MPTLWRYAASAVGLAAKCWSATIRQAEDGILLNSDHRSKIATAATWVCFVALGLCQNVSAQVPVHLEPRHPVAFENEALRVLSVNIEGGDTTLDHVHGNDIAIVCISGCQLRTRPLGGNWGDWLPRLPGQVGLNANAGQPSTHRHQAGNSRYHVASVENLLQRGWSQDAPVSGQATQLLTRHAPSRSTTCA